MVFKVPRSHLVCPRALLLVLAITTMALQHASPATSSYVDCGAVYDACYADKECMECESAGILNDEFDECWNDWQDGVGDAIFICELYSLDACCADAVSENDCMANDAFVELHMCVILSHTAHATEIADCPGIFCKGVDGVDGVDWVDGGDGDDSVDSAGGSEGNGAVKEAVLPLIATLPFVLGIAFEAVPIFVNSL